ncbi:hypothetical protein KDL45_16830, partial [bacterium]|nr:hypothetical protein [bacterium]
PRLIDVLTSEEWDVVRRALRERGEERDDEDGAMPPPEDFHILADNAAAVRAAANALETQGAGVLVMDTPFVGSVEEVAARLGAVWRLWSEQHAGAPAALVAGGESTVAIESEHGQGGRSHELALRLAMELGEGEWAAACVGTDGDDGNSGAMGAFAGPDTIRRAAAANLDADHILAAHDTARFFRDLGDQIPTRETGTNVMDLVVIVGAAPA